MDWRKTYPTLETVAQAHFETLSQWVESLPPPQTDVQHTVMRRLKKRHHELLSLQVREKAPHIADQFNGIVDMLERLGIKSPVERM